jgi:flagellar biosynthesis/type III secretory pathway M-ring protein FliF/YscJ
MSIAKSVLLFCLKCVVFSAIFWTMWSSVIRPITTASQTNNASSQETQTKGQMETYEKQVERANRQLDVSEDLQRRTDQYLSAQEENVKRMDAILREWEKQAGLRKK